jgi:demethylmenaquinone methyltransferase/2-methoxy-6-polyprenyl-1,4-benzoquinol methylase
VLDLATGSGDLALALQRNLPTAAITAADFSPEMLALAQSKGVERTVVADALNLPFDDNSFDAVTVAFGLRNMANWDLALQEIARVLVPGGHLLVLDFSLPGGVAGKVYHFYLRHCLPWLARMVTGERQAYDYLGASIEKFPSGGAMLAMLERNGFAGGQAQPLTGGVANLYCAHKCSSAMG